MFLTVCFNISKTKKKKTTKIYLPHEIFCQHLKFYSLKNTNQNGDLFLSKYTQKVKSTTQKLISFQNAISARLFCGVR